MISGKKYIKKDALVNNDEKDEVIAMDYDEKVFY
jgi:hypothetical protein